MNLKPIATLAAALSAAALLMAPALAQAETASKKAHPVAAKTQAKSPSKATAKSGKAKASAKVKGSAKSKAKVAKAGAAEKLALAPKHAAPAVSNPVKNVVAGGAAGGLGPAELAIAERVHVGYLPCEMGASVTLTADPQTPGYFNMQGKNFSYRMFPVQTSTGAVRLEDPKAGAVWLQLANKSMLMNQKQGVRLADDCTSPAQVAVAQALKVQPAPSLLEPVSPAQPVPGEFSRPVSTK